MRARKYFMVIFLCCASVVFISHNLAAEKSTVTTEVLKDTRNIYSEPERLSVPIIIANEMVTADIYRHDLPTSIAQMVMPVYERAVDLTHFILDFKLPGIFNRFRREF